MTPTRTSHGLTLRYLNLPSSPLERRQRIIRAKCYIQSVDRKLNTHKLTHKHTHKARRKTRICFKWNHIITAIVQAHIEDTHYDKSEYFIINIQPSYPSVVRPRLSLSLSLSLTLTLSADVCSSSSPVRKRQHPPQTSPQHNLKHTVRTGGAHEGSISVLTL